MQQLKIVLKKKKSPKPAPHMWHTQHIPAVKTHHWIDHINKVTKYGRCSWFSDAAKQNDFIRQSVQNVEQHLTDNFLPLCCLRLCHRACTTTGRSGSGRLKPNRFGKYRKRDGQVNVGWDFNWWINEFYFFGVDRQIDVLVFSFFKNPNIQSSKLIQNRIRLLLLWQLMTRKLSECKF